MSEPQASQNVSVESNGRVLTGGPGASLEALEHAIERSAPESSPAVTGKGEPAPAQTADGEQPKPSRGRERFSELTQQRDEERRRATEANERAVALAERLERLEQRAAQTGTPATDDVPRVVTKPETAPSVAATRPKPLEDEVGTTYAKYGDYVEDLADWRYEQREAQSAATRQKYERATRWNQTREAVKAQYPDFDEVLSNGPGAEITIGPTVEIGEARIRYLLDTPGGEHVIYKLAKDAEAATRAAGMSDFEFGMLFKGFVPSEQPAAPTPRASRAPAPYVPVNGGGRTTAKTSADAAASGNYEEYRRLRAAERGVKPKYK